MTVWQIVLLIYGLATLATFVWGAYDFVVSWRKTGHKEWKLFLLGLFMPAGLLLYCILRPISICMDYMEERKAKKRNEIYDKYHLRPYMLRLKGLPFTPSSNELIFIEDGYHKQANQCIRDNLDYIQECLDNNQYARPRFVYLPTLLERLAREHNSIEYMAPYAKGKRQVADELFTSSFLVNYMAAPENRGVIGTSFIRYCGEENGCSIFECMGFDITDAQNSKEVFIGLCYAFRNYPRPVGVMHQSKTLKQKKEEALTADADMKFDEETKKLMKDVEKKIIKLRKMGVSQWALDMLVTPQFQLSRMVITKDYRILLSDYHQMEIEMEPIVKAVYLLFLRHPEGILFKHLPSYRDELTQIYIKMKPYGKSKRVIKTINDVTNPLQNSINEKCARIKNAFIEAFDERIACHYYVDGQRGEAKRISLPRDLVIWETSEK